MRSPRADRRRVPAAGALLAALLAVSAAGAQDAAPPAAPASAPDARGVHIESAVDRLREDPLLSGKHKGHRLEWKDDTPEKKPAKPHPTDSWLIDWFVSLARFINDTSRFLLWALVLVLVAVAAVGAHRVVRLRGFGRRARATPAVSHVRDLDVRPESLPDDVGAAAWALWQAGRVPAALSLLYRGTLSRLIHRFEVPVAASTTEGECLELARPRLDAAALRYVTQVVRAWEAGTYGGRALSAAMGESLCTGFRPRLDGAPGGPSA